MRQLGVPAPLILVIGKGEKSKAKVLIAEMPLCPPVGGAMGYFSQLAEVEMGGC